MSSLFLVPTPIGNLKDITFRALEVLKAVDLVLCEDTRVSRKLFNHYSVTTPLKSYHLFNEHKIVSSIIQSLEEGKKIALISDAGTPAISDPGFLLVREALKKNIALECLPGATAFVPALVQSGLPCHSFYFQGFLPPKKGKTKTVKFLASLDTTFILYESPHKLIKTLNLLIEYCGEERKASASRELTKIYEETVRGSLLEIKQYFEQHTLKGEFVLSVEKQMEQTNEL